MSAGLIAATTRRGFFKLMAGAVALAAVPKPIMALASDIPRIWCDGVHDDAPGLSALLRGDVVDIAEHVADRITMVGRTLNAGGATFTVRSPVVVESGTIIAGGELTDAVFMNRGATVTMLMGVRNGKGGDDRMVTLRRCAFYGAEERPPAAHLVINTVEESLGVWTHKWPAKTAGAYRGVTL